MKTTIMLTIETSDKIQLMDEDGKKVSEEECKNYASEWHESLVKYVQNLGCSIHNNDEWVTPLEEYYNEDGELPEFQIKEIRADNKRSEHTEKSQS